MNREASFNHFCHHYFSTMQHFTKIVFRANSLTPFFWEKKISNQRSMSVSRISGVIRFSFSLFETVQPWCTLPSSETFPQSSSVSTQGRRGTTPPCSGSGNSTSSTRSRTRSSNGWRSTSRFVILEKLDARGSSSVGRKKGNMLIECRSSLSTLVCRGSGGICPGGRI